MNQQPNCRACKHLRRVGLYALRVVVAGCFVWLGLWALGGLALLFSRGKPAAEGKMASRLLVPTDLTGGG